METELSAYEQRRADEQALATRRYQKAVEVAYEGVRLLGVSGWSLLTRGTDGFGSPSNRVTIADTATGKVQIDIQPGGYKRYDRIVASVNTYRQVQFGPDDWETIRVVAANTERTFAEDRDAVAIAKAIVKSLVPLAKDVAQALDAEQARLSALRDRSAAVVNEFIRAGWHVNVARPGNNAATVDVPDGHPLKETLGIYGFRVNPKTGGIEYYSRPYVKSTATAADILAIK